MFEFIFYFLTFSPRHEHRDEFLRASSGVQIPEGIRDAKIHFYVKLYKERILAPPTPPIFGSQTSPKKVKLPHS